MVIPCAKPFPQQDWPSTTLIKHKESHSEKTTCLESAFVSLKKKSNNKINNNKKFCLLKSLHWKVQLPDAVSLLIFPHCWDGESKQNCIFPHFLFWYLCSRSSTLLSHTDRRLLFQSWSVEMTDEWSDKNSDQCSIIRSSPLLYEFVFKSTVLTPQPSLPLVIAEVWQPLCLLPVTYG